MNRSKDFDDIGPEAKELSKYLTEYSNQKHQQAMGREFATTFGTKQKELEFSPQDEMNQASMIIKSKFENYEDFATSFKKKSNFPASDLEGNSHFV